MKLTKGSWKDVQYPATVVVHAMLHPGDYFEPVDVNTPRSCAPVDGINFRLLFDANSGQTRLFGESMLPLLDVTFRPVGEPWSVSFHGRKLQVHHRIDKEDQLDPLLTNVEYIIPSLLSIRSGLSIRCETIEVFIGDQLEARIETMSPQHTFKLVDADKRILEIQDSLVMIGLSRSSTRFALACGYLQEALFFSATYYDHNPYTHSLVVILKCAQAIEILFGGKRDVIRQRCRELGIEEGVIDMQIIRILLARNDLGTAHASSFMPNAEEVGVLRSFAQRSAYTVQQLLLAVVRANAEDRKYLSERIERNVDKEKLLDALKESISVPEWSLDNSNNVRHVIFDDPRRR